MGVHGAVGLADLPQPEVVGPPVQLAVQATHHLLDVEQVFTNFTFTGYQQPITAMTPESLVQRKLIAPNLETTIVRGLPSAPNW